MATSEAPLRSRQTLVDVLEAVGMSERQLARTAGLSHATVNHLFTGRRTSCSSTTARQIEAALGCQPGVLFSDVQPALALTQLTQVPVTGLNQCDYEACGRTEPAHARDWLYLQTRDMAGGCQEPFCYCSEPCLILGLLQHVDQVPDELFEHLRLVMAGQPSELPGPAPLDCRSPAGETAGLVDAAIHVLRVVSRSDLSPQPVVEAMRDFAADPEVQAVVSAAATVSA